MKKLLLAAAVLFATFALADRVVTLQSGSLTLTNGDWVALDDGGFRFGVCGFTTKAEDGGRAPMESPCVSCEPGPWNGAPAKCLAAYRDANNL